MFVRVPATARPSGCRRRRRLRCTKRLVRRREDVLHGLLHQWRLSDDFAELLERRSDLHQQRQLLLWIRLHKRDLPDAVAAGMQDDGLLHRIYRLLFRLLCERCLRLQDFGRNLHRK